MHKSTISTTVNKSPFFVAEKSHLANFRRQVDEALASEAKEALAAVATNPESPSVNH